MIRNLNTYNRQNIELAEKKTNSLKIEPHFTKMVALKDGENEGF